MNFPKIIIYNNNPLFNILNEISDQIQFKFINIEKNKLNLKTHKEYFLVCSEKINNYQNYLYIDKFPIEISKLVQLININILRKSYELKSKISIGNYILDINSKLISNKKNNLKLTGKEIEIISFLNDRKSSVSIEELEQRVWNYTKNVETHTVETHIHRLKKKFKDTFKDENFINSTNSGYKLS